jgi:hypothetical protein
VCSAGTGHRLDQTVCSVRLSLRRNLGVAYRMTMQIVGGCDLGGGKNRWDWFGKAIEIPHACAWRLAHLPRSYAAQLMAALLEQLLDPSVPSPSPEGFLRPIVSRAVWWDDGRAAGGAEG